MNIALFGGAFNPIHIAHTLLAKRAMNEFYIDKVIFMPTYISPHKNTTKSVSYQHRINMVHLATDDEENFIVSDYESKIEGNSYSYLTLEHLKKKYPNDKLFLIIGADMYVSLLQWKNPEIIFNLCDIITCPRDEENYNSLLEYSKILENNSCVSHIMKNPVMMLSSTLIRENPRLSYEKGFLNKKVFDYIIEHNLYT